MSKSYRQQSPWKAFSCLIPVVIVGVQLGQPAAAETKSLKKTHTRKAVKTHQAPAAAQAKPAAVPPAAKAAHVPPSDLVSHDQEQVHVTGFGTSSGRQLKAQNEMMSLSAKDLARLPAQNVTEALARLPGVTVMPTSMQGNFGGIDTAARGTGATVSLRGMNGQYNINQINGIDVAEAAPFSRTVSLDLLPPTGFFRIDANKTLTPGMDGDAIGGIVNFEMPNAFDYGHGTHGSLQLGGQYNEKAADYGASAIGGNGAAEISSVFGKSDQFGFYMSGYYNQRYFAAGEQTYSGGEWGVSRAMDAQGDLYPGQDPVKSLQLFGVDPQASIGVTKRYGGTAGFEWRPDSSTRVYLQGTESYSDTQQDIYQVAIHGNDSGASSAGMISYVEQADGSYAPSITRTNVHYWYETNPTLEQLGTMKLGMDKKLGRFSISPSAFLSWGTISRDHIETSAWQSGVAAFDGAPNFVYKDGMPTVGLTSAQAAVANGTLDFPTHNRGEYVQSDAWQLRIGTSLDMSYRLDRFHIDTISAGFKYQTSWRNYINRDTEGQDNGGSGAYPAGGTLSQTGLVDGSLSSLIPGAYNFYTPTISRSALLSNYLADPYNWKYMDKDAWNGNTIGGTETVYAGYVSAQMHFGKLQVVPGIRFEQSDLHNTYWASGNEGVSTADAHYGWSATNSHYFKALPSIHLTYRPRQDTVYRASVWTSYTRPSFFQLSGGSQITRNDDGTLSITTGNPSLKATTAVNYDLSWQWMPSSTTSFSLAGFYKQLSNYIYDNGGSYNNETTTAGIANSVSHPENGGSATLFGLEFAFEHQFKGLPAPFDGLGVRGTATWEMSRAHLNNAYLSSTENMQDAPRWMTNAGAFYNKGSFQFDLNWRFVDAYLYEYGLWGTPNNFKTNLNSSSLDAWVQPSLNLDAHLGYAVTKRLHVDFSAQNLGVNRFYRLTIGRHSNAVPQNILTSRTFFLNAGYRF